MKKITFLFLLLMVSMGYSQVVLEDFEGATPSLENFDGISSSVQPNPDAVAPNPSANAFELITASAGQPWQGAKLVMQNNKIDMTTTNKVVTADVYSNTPKEFLVKLVDGDVGGSDPAQESKTAAAHSGSGWENLTFDFNVAADTGQPGYNPPVDQFSGIIFYPLYDISNNGWCDGCGQNNALDTTTYVDNISGIAGDPVAAPTPDPEAAPVPTVPNGEVYSIYNDTNGYTNSFPFAYDFGTLGGEPNLDQTGGTNLAYKFDFTFSGYGVGEGGPDDVSAYNFVNFNYWAEAGVPGFQFRLISNEGGSVTEHIYEIGTDEAVVTGEWVQVSIPMSHFTNSGFSSANLFQWKCDPFNQVPTTPGIVYVDNIILTTSTLSVNEFDSAQLSVYPNPSKGDWNISSSIMINNLSVFDILGKEVMAIPVNAKAVKIDASSLSAGMYFVKVRGNNGDKTIKVLKN
jgi:hypothetical protein